MKTLLLAVALAFTASSFAADTPKKAPAKKEAATPAIKPKVKRPCKPGQTAEKDDCHEIRKLK